MSAADFLSSLDQYDIAIPVRVGPQGEALGGDGAGQGEGPRSGAGGRRRRRSLDDRPGDTQLYYQLSTSRANFLLNLTLHRGLLSERFRVEYWRRGRLAWSHPYSPHCHYVGHLQHLAQSSHVALSNCNGLVRSSAPFRPARYITLNRAPPPVVERITSH